MTIDTDALLAGVDLVAVAARYSTLKRHGREHVGLCPFHADHKASFHVIPEKGFCHCMACGWNGDAIKLVMDGSRLDFRAACADLGGDQTAAAVQREHAPKPEALPERLTDVPPADVPDPDFRTRHWGTPAAVWRYRDADGATLFFVARYNLGDGAKVTPQWTWGSRDGGTTWAWGTGHFREPRPLYGLDRLAQRPDSPVLLVEGEKCADAADKVLPQYIGVTWPGGTNGIEKCDWSPLAGRGVLIWPDQDLQVFKDEHPQAGMVKPTREQPGTKAAHRIAAKLHALGAKWIKVIDVTPYPQGAK